MPKVSIDDLVEKMLDNSDKYPELKVYAAGLKELYRQSREQEKKPKALTSKESKPTIPESVDVKGTVSIKDVMSLLGAGV